MKKNGMKVMAMIGSAVMAAGMLAGCGNSGAAASEGAGMNGCRYEKQIGIEKNFDVNFIVWRSV